MYVTVNPMDGERRLMALRRTQRLQIKGKEALSTALRHAAGPIGAIPARSLYGASWRFALRLGLPKRPSVQGYLE